MMHQKYKDIEVEKLSEYFKKFTGIDYKDNFYDQILKRDEKEWTIYNYNNIDFLAISIGEIFVGNSPTPISITTSVKYLA